MIIVPWIKIAVLTHAGIFSCARVVFRISNAHYAERILGKELLPDLETTRELPVDEKVAIICGFTEFRLATTIIANAPRLRLGNFHGKYRTSTQTRSASNQAECT